MSLQTQIDCEILSVKIYVYVKKNREFVGFKIFRSEKQKLVPNYRITDAHFYFGIFQFSVFREIQNKKTNLFVKKFVEH